MNKKLEQKQLAILRILQNSDKPLGSLRVTEQLTAMGYGLSERTVRNYFLVLDQEGLTEKLGRRGRRLTDQGRQELNTAGVIGKVGYLAARIDQMIYRMDFDLASLSGTVVTNISIIELKLLDRAVPLLTKVFAARYAMGQLVALFRPGQRIGEITVPDGCVGIGTVCSVTLNGILLASGVPTHSRFGGLLELQEGDPRRFVEIIHYEGTTIDPLEVFIRSGMTDYAGAIETGNGRIGVGFREVPAESRDRVIGIAEKLEGVDLGGFLSIGWPGQPLLDIPVAEGRVGVIVIGGLNPAAILEEYHMRVRSHALAGLTDYQSLFPYTELVARVDEFT